MTRSHPGAPVIVYAEPDVERTRGLHRTWRGHSQRLAVAAPYNDTGVDHLAVQVLDALDKDVTLTSGKIGGENGIHLAAAWLLAVDATDVLLTGAERLTVSGAQRWVSWLSGLGVRAWLLFATPTPRRPEPRLAEIFDVLADEWGAERQSESRLLKRWSTSKVPHQNPPPPRHEEHPSVPRVQGPTFLTICERILPAEAYTDLAERFDAHVAEMRPAITRISGKNANDRVCAALRHRLDAATSTDQGVLVAVAGQVAALVPAGWHVSVNLQRLTAALETLPRSGRAEADRWWDRLLVYRDPLIGTVAALYMADVDIVDQTHLTLEDVKTRDDGSATVNRPSGGTVTLPSEQAIFIRAQVAFRQMHGVDGDGMLLRTHRADSASRRHLRMTLHVPMAEVGVTPSDVPVRNKRITNPIWLDRYGITVTKIGRAPSAKRSRKRTGSSA